MNLLSCEITLFLNTLLQNKELYSKILFDHAGSMHRYWSFWVEKNIFCRVPFIKTRYNDNVIQLLIMLHGDCFNSDIRAALTRALFSKHSN